MAFRQRYAVSGISIIMVISIQAQSISQTKEDERKRLLLEQIKPPQTFTVPSSLQKSNTDISLDKEDIQGGYRRYIYGTGSAEFDDKYQVSPHVKTFTKDQLFKIEEGTETKSVIIDGKVRSIPVKDYEHRLDEISQRRRLQGVVINVSKGGLNLSGWKGKKKTSSKSKSILQHVFNMEVE